MQGFIVLYLCCCVCSSHLTPPALPPPSSPPPLPSPHLSSQIDDRNAAIEEDYIAICSIAPRLAEIATLEEFKWARMCVCSRNFGLLINGVRTSALVPHADMLNHYRPRETKWTFDNERQAFTITTLQTIRAGSQIYDSYGQKCNHRFLLNYVSGTLPLHAKLFYTNLTHFFRASPSKTTARATASAPTKPPSNYALTPTTQPTRAKQSFGAGRVPPP